ncbi:hypothetical protein BLX87_12705 [Bacillus sp. VT-16-64]|nr:hypothetical protein BLX87_12705 [Bacillus sp. VT-16-64]
MFIGFVACGISVKDSSGASTEKTGEDNLAKELTFFSYGDDWPEEGGKGFKDKFDVKSAI